MEATKRVRKLTVADASVGVEIHTILDESSDQLVPVIESSGGLTKREYFAAMAMQGIFANSAPADTDEFAHMVVNATKAADALIAALNMEAVNV